MIFPLFIGLFLLASLAAIAYRLARWVKVCRSMQSQCLSEWATLQSLLSDRHLIVSHLLDALPEQLPEQKRVSSQVMLLAEALAKVELAVAEVKKGNPSTVNIHRVGYHESEMLELLRELTGQLGDTAAQVQSSDATAADRSTDACLTAIAAGEAAINDAKSTFNGTALTHQTHGCTRMAKIAKRLGCQQPDYCVINIQWYGINSDSNQGDALASQTGLQ